MDWTYSFNQSDPSLVVGIARRGERYITRIVAADVKIQARGTDLDEVLGEVRWVATASGYRQDLSQAIDEARAGIPGQAPEVSPSEPLLPTMPALPLL